MNYLKYAILFFISLQVSAQNLDSLYKIYNNTSLSDSNRLDALDNISWEFRNNNPDTAIILGWQQIQYAQKAKIKRYEANGHLTIGTAYKTKGNYPKTLDHYLQALSIREAMHDSQGIGACNINIGNVYMKQTNYQKALEYNLKALQVFEKANDKKGMGYCYGNIGTVYASQNNFTMALEYLFKGLKLYEQMGDKRGIGICLGNVGGVYTNQLNYPKALESFDKALKIRLELGDKHGVSICYVNLATLSNKLKNYKAAISYCDSVVKITKQLGDIDNQRLAYENLAFAYNKMGKNKQAYQNEVLFKKLTDSIFNADNSKQLGDMKTKFEVEKKEAELKLKSEAAELINNQEKKQQQFIIYAVVFVLVIVFVFSGFLFRRFKITQKQKHIIQLQKDEVSRQKHLVEEHQKEIIDSITYAKRLQQAILPADAEIKKHLPNNFIYYQPKDIVAGDFYWMEHLDGITFMAAADSTGHGVPGAMVSIVCSNSLNRAVKEFGLRDTGKILDKTRELVLETFEKSGEQIKDGMDISLLAINKHRQQINWSGANNQLWYISNNKLIEVKADKQPIGKTDNPTPFTTHHIALNPNDIFYLMTDGYADQFGGTKGKKFKYKQLEDLVIANSDKSLDEQKQILTTTFNTWKTNLEQVDDVTIIGIKM